MKTLTVLELSKLYNINRQTIYNNIKKGILSKNSDNKIDLAEAIRVFGEPVKTIGTTFCVWTTENKDWRTGQIENYEDNSDELLSIFDGNPQTYVDWATEYFDESFIESGIPLETVTEIYSGKALTKEMVLTIVEELEDWEQLETDLNEIGYPYKFN